MHTLSLHMSLAVTKRSMRWKKCPLTPPTGPLWTLCCVRSQFTRIPSPHANSGLSAWRVTRTLDLQYVDSTHAAHVGKGGGWGGKAMQQAIVWRKAQ